MNKAIIEFSSVTYALKAKEIVEKHGGKASIRKNTKATKNEGCGYSLTVIGNIDKFTNLFDLNRVKYKSAEMI